MMELSNLKIGKVAIILKLDNDKIIREKLMKLGLIKGAKIVVVRKTIFGGPIQIKVRNFYLAIRKSEAKKIEVKYD